MDYTYHYSNFGIPGLGLKRGLDADLVIAPYATALAAMVDPAAAVRNLGRIAVAGGQGDYGFYEALDYTPGRVPAGKPVAVVRAFMAHHQGMTVVAIADAVLDGRMRQRFHAEPIIQATETLLQERAPRNVAVARSLPIGVMPDNYEAAFGEDRAEFARRGGTLTTIMEVLVSAEEDAEVRRISGTTARIIDITSCAELALVRAADDIAHPAFARIESSRPSGWTTLSWRPAGGGRLLNERYRPCTFWWQLV